MSTTSPVIATGLTRGVGSPSVSEPEPSSPSSSSFRSRKSRSNPSVPAEGEEQAVVRTNGLCLGALVLAPADGRIFEWFIGGPKTRGVRRCCRILWDPPVEFVCGNGLGLGTAVCNGKSFDAFDGTLNTSTVRRCCVMEDIIVAGRDGSKKSVRGQERKRTSTFRSRSLYVLESLSAGGRFGDFNPRIRLLSRWRGFVFVILLFLGGLKWRDPIWLRMCTMLYI
ncbi:hypothetical protein DFH11DRAFT_1657650 [Phellopilus nigrolimitatus]|nr:hypothetical protein DFH11DRAFT_1657650 [Phellopilus nigrolimitatus]